MWWLCATVFAADEAEDFRSYLDQAKFFLKKEWYKDAREQLELAVATEDGRLDPEAWFLLAQVRYELGDLPGAQFAADRALVKSIDDEQIKQTAELLDYFLTKFGFVTVLPTADTQSAVLSISLESTLFDPDLKLWLNKLIASQTEPVALPYEVGLPSGTYVINGVAVVVASGAKTEIVPMTSGRSQLAVRTPEVELGVGASGFVGRPVQNLLPAGVGEVMVSSGLGPFVFGAGGGWSAQPYRTRLGDINASFVGWQVGARVGVSIPTSVVSLRPSATWRMSLLPGLEVGCDNNNEAWTCARDTPERELYVYTSAVTHAFGGELAVVHRPKADAPLGVGLKAGGDFMLGSLPRTGTARSSGEASEELLFAVDGNRGVNSASWRILAVMNLRL